MFIFYFLGMFIKMNDILIFEMFIVYVIRFDVGLKFIKDILDYYILIWEKEFYGRKYFLIIK